MKASHCAVGVYFVILFAILGTYLAFSLPNNAQRLHISSASELSMTQHNKILVQARDLDTGSTFSGYHLESRWIQSNLNGIEGSEVIREKLPQDGEAVLSIPKTPTDEVAGVEITLWDSEGTLRKSAILPSSVFTPEPIVQHLAAADDSPSFFQIVTPAAFMFNKPNDVIIALFDNGEPWKGTLHIEQTYGQPADFLKSIHVEGLGRLKIAVPAAADFKLTADDKTFFATFVPNEKTLHVAMDSPVLTPEHNPVISVTPVGTMPEITIDYFDENAWIGRQKLPAHQARNADLMLDYVYAETPSVFYARVSTSAFPTPDSSQTFPVIASKSPISEIKQAEIALKTLKKWPAQHPEHVYLSSLLKQSPKKAVMIRDYALALVATHHDPTIQMRVRTEDAEQQAFEQRKSDQKAVMNVVLVCWFALGLIVSLVLIIRNARKRRMMWDEILSSDHVECGDLPPQTSGFALFCLLILFIGFMVSLFFMMQIV